MSHPISDEPPSVKDELERKTVDLLETLVHRSETHRMTKADLGLVAKALWNVTSGLVSSEVSQLCSATAGAGTTGAAMKRHFIGKGKVLTVIWLADGTGYIVNTRTVPPAVETGVEPFKSEVVTRPVKSEPGLREPELTHLFTALVKSGYVEL
jgi:hypothetical protein